MTIVLKKKTDSAPNTTTIRKRAAVVRRDWTAREHCERYLLANVVQRMLAVELCGHATY